MKSGAGDDPFADPPSDSADSGDELETEPSDGGKNQDTIESDQSNSQTTISTSALPYKYRRDSVKDDRSQQPMFLQEDTEELIDETVDKIESQFDETVYKTDVVEAMIVAGGENITPEAVLRRWGYGIKNS